MVSQSWDGKRVYFTTSLLANWDKTGADDEQFLRGFRWDGKELTPAFAVDFHAEKLGRAHHMQFGTHAIKAAYEDVDDALASREVGAGSWLSLRRCWPPWRRPTRRRKFRLTSIRPRLAPIAWSGSCRRRTARSSTPAASRGNSLRIPAAGSRCCR